ncbi:MAG: hypothetical protein UR20_C0041G0007, partial [Candidatus Woesebacteria bacterium GW2011_GWE2_31_6]
TSQIITIFTRVATGGSNGLTAMTEDSGRNLIFLGANDASDAGTHTYAYWNASSNTTTDISDKDAGDFFAGTGAGAYISSMVHNERNNTYMTAVGFGGGNNFAYYDIRTDIAYPLVNNDTGNWLNSDVLASAYNPNSKRVYVGGVAGDFGYLDENLIAQNIIQLDVSNVTANTVQAITIDKIRNLTYFGTAIGQLAYFDEQSNKTISLNESLRVMGWGSQKIYSLSYDNKTNRTFIFGNSGKYAVYGNLTGVTNVATLLIGPNNPSFNVSINTTDGRYNHTNVNLTLIINHTDATGLYNITNWYENNQSLLVLNMPFVTNTTDVKDYSGYNNNGTISGALWQRYLNEDNNSLVLLLPFDEDNSTTAIDTSDYRNDGVLSGVALNTTNCITGTCYTFNGVNSNITTNNLNLGGANEFTVETWIYPLSAQETAVNYRNTIYSGHVFATPSWWLEVFGNDIFIQNLTTPFPIVATTGDIIQNNQWYLVSLTKTGSAVNSNLTIYVNGALKISGLMNTTPTTRSFIGSLGGTAGDKDIFNGTMDNFRIYNKALTSSEIQDHYEKYKLYYQPSFKFDGKQGINFTRGQLGTAINSSSAITMEAWVNQKSFPSPTGAQVVLAGTIGNSGGGFGITILGAGTVNVGGRSIASDAIQQTNSLSNISLNNWTHIVGEMEFANDLIKIYINGKLDKTFTASFSRDQYNHSILSTATKDTIGFFDGQNRYFNGSIQGVRIYNRSLSANQIYELYNSYNTSALNKLVSEETTFGKTYKAQVYVANSTSIGNVSNTSEVLILDTTPILSSPVFNRNVVPNNTQILLNITGNITTLNLPSGVSSVWADIYDWLNNFIKRIYASLIDTINSVWQFDFTTNEDFPEGNITLIIQANGTGLEIANNLTTNFTLEGSPYFVNNPVINTTNGLNTSNQDLNVFFTPRDNQSIDINYSIQLFKNNVSEFILRNVDLINNTFTNYIINETNTTNDDTFKSQIWITDGYSNSTLINTTELLIFDSYPTIYNQSVSPLSISNRQTIEITADIVAGSFNIDNVKVQVTSPGQSKNYTMSFTSGNQYKATLSGDETQLIGAYAINSFIANSTTRINQTSSTLTFQIISGGADPIGGGTTGGGGGGGTTEITISNLTLGTLQKRIDRYLFFFPGSDEVISFKELLKTNKEIKNCKVSIPFACKFTANQPNALIEIDIIQKNKLFWTIPDEEGEIELISEDGEVTRVPILLKVYNFNYKIPLKGQSVAGIETSKDITGIPIWIPVLAIISLIGFSVYKIGKDKRRLNRIKEIKLFSK